MGSAARLVSLTPYFDIIAVSHVVFRIKLHQSQPAAAVLLAKMRQKTVDGDGESLCPPDFPDLVSLSELNPTTQALWLQSTSSIPYLVEPRRCWHPSLPPVLEIYRNVWGALRSRSDYAVFVKGEKLKVSCKKARGKIEQKLQGRIEEAITTAMFQSQRDDLAGACPSVLLNVQLERLSAVLEPPERARSSLHVCEDSFQVQVNVVPSGRMVDLHYGKDLLHLPAYVNTDEPFTRPWRPWCISMF